MFTPEISAFHHAFEDVSLKRDFDIHERLIDPVIKAVAQAFANIEWSPYKGQLQGLHNRLCAYRIRVLSKSLKELEDKCWSSFPSYMRKELEALALKDQSPAIIHQRVSKMLEDAAWGPLRSRLLPLKLRIDALVKKEQSSEKLDTIDHIGISTLVFSVTARDKNLGCWNDHDELVIKDVPSTSYSTSYAGSQIIYKNLNAIQEQIEKGRTKFLFSTCYDVYRLFTNFWRPIPLYDFFYYGMQA